VHPLPLRFFHKVFIFNSLDGVSVCKDKSKDKMRGFFAPLKTTMLLRIRDERTDNSKRRKMEKKRRGEANLSLFFFFEPGRSGRLC
jgi:hypothetical protein